MWEIVTNTWDTIKTFFLLFTPVLDFIIETKVPEQIDNIQYMELFTNAWFMVPYVAWLVWNIYHKQISSLISILLLTGCWVFFGTPYMRGVLSQDTIQLGSVIPLIGGACLVLGIIVYLFFFRSD